MRRIVGVILEELHSAEGGGAEPYAHRVLAPAPLELGAFRKATITIKLDGYMTRVTSCVVSESATPLEGRSSPEITEWGRA